MPKASKETASHIEDMGVMEGRYEELGGYTVGFETFREDADGTPLFKGLPDDRCQSPHWGYVVNGRITFRYADHEELYETGDAYYAPPGHIPVISGGHRGRRVQPDGGVSADDGRGRGEPGRAPARLSPTRNVASVTAQRPAQTR